MPRLRNAKACCRAIGDALTWLGPHFGNEETWSTPPYTLAAYHKIPYLLSVTGSVAGCRSLLTWIKENLVTEEGELLTAPPGECHAPMRARVREKVWVVLAAQQSGRFDIAYPSARFIAEQQGLATGAVYDLDAEGNRDPYNDVRTTACAGLAFLSCGMLKHARAAGRSVCRVIELQPDEKHFHVCLDAQSRLIRKFGRAEASRYTVAKARGRTQLSFLGLPMVFLAKLHLATAEKEWLEGAMDCFAFAERYSKEAWAGEDSCPVGWGAAALYSVTRKRVYYDAADRVAQVWTRWQRPDGSWRPCGEAPDDAATIALTAQAALCLLESNREAQ